MAWTQYAASGKVFKSVKEALGETAPLSTWERVKSWVARTWASVSWNTAKSCMKKHLVALLHSLKRKFEHTPAWPIQMRPYGEEGRIMAEVSQLLAAQDCVVYLGTDTNIHLVIL